MKLSEIRQRGIDQRLQDYRVRLSRDLMPALAVAIVAGILLLSTLVDPRDWAKGEWFQEGGWLREKLGYEGAVTAVRVSIGLLALLGLGYFAWTVYRLTRGLAAQRRKMAADYKVFDPPDQPRS